MVKPSITTVILLIKILKKTIKIEAVLLTCLSSISLTRRRLKKSQKQVDLTLNEK